MLYSNQEAFDLVVEKLVAQGEPSMKEGFDNTCAYLAYNGNRCAAGHLVPDDLLKKMSNFAEDWTTVCEYVPEARKIAIQGFITELQDAHDLPVLFPVNYCNWRTGWVSKMRDVATTYRLDLTKLDDLATEEWQKNS